MDTETKEPRMESIQDEIFESPLSDDTLEEVAGGAETWTDYPERTGVGQSEAFDSFKDSATDAT